MTNDEWAYWCAYQKLDPFGESRHDERYARYMAVYGAAHGVCRTDHREYMLFPTPDEPPPKPVAPKVAATRLNLFLGAIRGRHHR